MARAWHGPSLAWPEPGMARAWHGPSLSPGLFYLETSGLATVELSHDSLDRCMASYFLNTLGFP